MSKVTQELLAKAEALNHVGLSGAIEALKFLGDDATGNNQEYKDLKALVEKVEAGEELPTGDGDGSGDGSDGAGDNAGDGGDTSGADGAGDGNADAAKKVKADENGDVVGNSAMRYAGIKLIGALWYSQKDNYAKGHATADECADYYAGA